MQVPSTLYPNRSLVFPFSIVFFPMIWFVIRETPVRVVDGRRVVTPLSRTISLSIVAVVVSYLIAATLVSATAPRNGSLTSWQRVIFRPTDDVLVTLIVLWSTFAAYVALESTVALPWWSELVVGIPLLWPLFVAILLTYAVGNAAPTLQAFAVQASFTVVGLALSAVWIYLLSTGIASVVFTPK